MNPRARKRPDARMDVNRDQAMEGDGDDDEKEEHQSIY
jgi:hypothetical protein